MSDLFSTGDLVPHVQEVEQDVIARYVSTINAANMAATWIVGEAAFRWKQETKLTWEELADECPGFSGSSLNTRALIYERFNEIAEDLRLCTFGHFRAVLSLPTEEAVRLLFWVDRTGQTLRSTERMVNKIRTDGFDRVNDEFLIVPPDYMPAAPVAPMIAAPSREPHQGEKRGPHKSAVSPPTVGKPIKPEEYKAVIGNDVALPEEGADEPKVRMQQHLEAIMACEISREDAKRVAKKLREKADVLDPPAGKPPVATAEDVRSIGQLWNMLENVKHIAHMTPARMSTVKTRLSDPFFRENYRAAMLRIDNIPGLTGKNDRNWVANFDWFIRPNTVPKIMEGGYDQWGTDSSNTVWDDVFGTEQD